MFTLRKITSLLFAFSIFSFQQCAKYTTEPSFFALLLLGNISGFTIGGSVIGFFENGNNLVLKESNSGIDANISGGSSNYEFPFRFEESSQYLVTIQNQPTSPDFTCSLFNAAGSISDQNITNINVECIAGKIVSGSVQTPPVFTTTDLTTFAGETPPGSTSGNVDGTGNAARFNQPFGVTTDGSNLYVVDRNNASIRKINIATAEVTTISTSPSNPFADPVSITTDGINLFITDLSLHLVFKTIISTGVTTILAGGNTGGGVNCPGVSQITCRDGIGTQARFNVPFGIVTDGNNIYVSDRSNNRVRKIVIANGVVTTLAGDGSTGATQLQLPGGMAIDSGNLYVADEGHGVIRFVPTTTGSISTLVAVVGNPRAMTSDGSNLYILTASSRLRMYDSLSTGGTMSTLAGNSGTGFVDGDGTTVARMNFPVGVTNDGNALYISDAQNHAIRKYK